MAMAPNLKSITDSQAHGEFKQFHLQGSDPLLHDESPKVNKKSNKLSLFFSWCRSILACCQKLHCIFAVLIENPQIDYHGLFSPALLNLLSWKNCFL